MKNVDYKQLKQLVSEVAAEAGVMGPSAPEGVPHRMPAADPAKDLGDPEANEKYMIALAAREATEALVEALDQPIYDGAYEHAFKATMSLRKALNELIGVGARPRGDDNVVAPPTDQQKYSVEGGYAPVNYVTGGGFEGGEGE